MEHNQKKLNRNTFPGEMGYIYHPRDQLQEKIYADKEALIYII